MLDGEREREREGRERREREREREERERERDLYNCYLFFSCVWHPGSAPQLVSIDEQQLNLFKITGDSVKVHVHVYVAVSLYLTEISIFPASFEYVVGQQRSLQLLQFVLEPSS